MQYKEITVLQISKVHYSEFPQVTNIAMNVIYFNSPHHYWRPRDLPKLIKQITIIHSCSIYASQYWINEKDMKTNNL